MWRFRVRIIGAASSSCGRLNQSHTIDKFARYREAATAVINFVRQHDNKESK